MKARAVLVIRAVAWVTVRVLPRRLVRKVQAEVDAALFKRARRG